MDAFISTYTKVRWLLLALALATIAFATLGDLRHHDWAFDDVDYIENAARAQDDFFYVFSPDKLWAARPTVHLFFWALYPFCQSDPGAYHLANLALHALNAWLCAALVYMWCGRFSTGIGAALFFLFHLSAFRAVYWIAGVSLTLATFFALVSTLAILLFLRTKKKTYYASALAAFALSIFAHSAAISLLAPLAIVLFSRAAHKIKYAMAFPLIAISALAINSFYYPTPLNETSDFSIDAHVISNYFHMLFRLLAGAHCDAWLPTIGTDAQIGLGFFMAAILLFAAWKTSAIRAGAMWTFAALAPFSLWPDGANIWRYYYLASVGSSFLQALLLAHATGRLATWIGARTPLLKEAPFVLATLALTLVSIASSDAHQAVQYSFSGLYFAKSKHYEQALPQYEKALELAPNNALAMSWRYHQAICQFKTGQTLIAYSNMIDIVPSITDRDDIYAWLIQAHAVLYQMEGVELGKNDDFTLYKEGQNAFRRDVIRFFQEGRFRTSRSLALTYLHYFPDDREIAGVLEQSLAALRADSDRL